MVKERNLFVRTEIFCMVTSICVFLHMNYVISSAVGHPKLILFYHTYNYLMYKVISVHTYKTLIFLTNIHYPQFKYCPQTTFNLQFIRCN